MNPNSAIGADAADGIGMGNMPGPSARTGPGHGSGESNRLCDMAALLVFGLLSLWATGPALFSCGRVVCAAERSDVWAHLWVFWRTRFAMRGGDLDYWVSHLLTYPGWIREPMAVFDPLLPWLSVPLQYGFGLAATYNLLVLAGLIFTGWAGYRLTGWLAGSRPAGLVGGVIIAMNPFVYRQLAGGYAEYAWWGLAPLTAWLYLRSLRTPGPGAVAFYVASLALTVLMSIYGAACFGLVALGSLLLEGLRAFRGRRNLLRRAIRVQTTALLCLLPLLLFWGWELHLLGFKGMSFGRPFPLSALAAHAGQTPDGAERDRDYTPRFLAWRALRGSLDIKDLCVPGRDRFAALPDLRLALKGTPIESFGEDNAFSSERVFQVEWWAVLALAVCGWACERRERRAFAAGWLALALLFLLVALGPYPIWDGRIVDAMPLPYAWLYRFAPGFSRLVIPARAFLGSVMGLAIVAANGWRILADRMAHDPRFKTRRVWLAGLGATAVFVSFHVFGWEHPFLPQHAVDLPGIYSELAADSREIALLELPFSRGDVMKRMYAQTVHQKPIFRGLPAQEWSAENGMRGIYENPLIVALESPPLDRRIPWGLEEAGRSLADMGFGYLILHADGYHRMEEFQAAKRLAEEAFGAPHILSREALVWRLPSEGDPDLR